MKRRDRRESPYFYYVWPFEIEEKARLFIAQGAASFLWLKLPPQIQYAGFRYDFFLEGPRDFELIDSSGRTAGVGIATNVPAISRKTCDSGRVRYCLSFSGKKQELVWDRWGYSSGNIWSPIMYKITHPQKTELLFWGEKGDGYLYPQRKIDVDVLSWKSGIQPERTKINIELVSAMLLSPAEISELISTYAKMGVNMVNQNWYWWNGVPPVNIKYYRRVSDELHRHNIESLIGGRPGSEINIVRKFPATLFDGTHSDNVACMSILTEHKNSFVEKEEMRWVKGVDADGVLYCNEYAAVSGNTLGPSVCFDKRCLTKFKVFLNTSGCSTKGFCKGKPWLKWRKQWIDYRCWQNAQIAGRIRNALKRYRPNANLYLYSAKQTEYNRDRYTIDWKKMAPNIDFAIMAAEGKDAFQPTQQVLGDIPIIGRVCISVSPMETVISGYEGIAERYWPEVCSLKSRGLRSLIDSGCNGLRVWGWYFQEGRHTIQISEIASIVARFEHFLERNRRVDEKIPSPGKGFDIRALEHEGEILLFIFNKTTTERVVNVSQIGRSISRNICLLDEEGLVVRTNSLNVGPLDARVFHLKPT